MDTNAFIAWALDDARTKDQRFTVELLVEEGVRRWNANRQIYASHSLEEIMARNRERELNPAYDPFYSEQDLAKTAEALGGLKDWWPRGGVIANLDVVPFFPAMEWIWISQCFATDLSPLARLPALRKLHLGSLGSDHGCGACEDYKFLGECTSLRELTLGFGAAWPDFAGIEKLQELRLLELSGNLLALPRGPLFPKVERAQLFCRPLYARSVADFPSLPACQSLTLSGAHLLDGIEKMPQLRNLTLLGYCQDFAPLAALSELTCLTIEPVAQGEAEKLPLDIRPIAHLPSLRYFQIGPRFDIYPDMPRDYAPLVEAPALRELSVRNCPPVQMEVAAIQAGLLPWDDVFLRPEPRPLPPLTVITAPHTKQPRRVEEQPDADHPGPIDLGLRDCEARWIKTFAHGVISERVRNSDWGKVDVTGLCRVLAITIESFDVVEQLPEIVDATREVLARLRPDYIALFSIHLKVRPPILTPAQQAVEDAWREQQNEEEYEQTRRDVAEYRERLHEWELKKQQGLEIDPDDFSPSEYGAEAKTTAGGAPAEEDEDDDSDFDLGQNDGDSDDEGGIAIENDHDPEVNFLDEDQHPLYDNYLCAGTILLGELWIYSHLAGIGCHLMRRDPDREIAEEEEKRD